MSTPNATARKRPVNLSLSEGLVNDARALSNNLSATVETLLGEYVARERAARADRRRLAEQACREWNGVLAARGSFADAHSPL